MIQKIYKKRQDIKLKAKYKSERIISTGNITINKGQSQRKEEPTKNK